MTKTIRIILTEISFSSVCSQLARCFIRIWLVIDFLAVGTNFVQMIAYILYSGVVPCLESSVCFSFSLLIGFFPLHTASLRAISLVNDKQGLISFRDLAYFVWKNHSAQFCSAVF